MSSDDESKILPPRFETGQNSQVNRTMLGLLLVLLGVAVVLALWFLIFDGDDDSDSALDALPTAVPLPTSTPLPAANVPADDPVAPTTAPVATATPVPDGFDPCAGDQAPLTTATYIVDTLDTPLNQRVDPAVTAEQVGTFDPGQTGLAFSGDCLVNLTDGYVWWEINNGTTDVWVASDFVTPG